MLAAVVAALTALPAGAQELNRGAVLALSCAGCHGTDGKSPSSMPALDGHDRVYLARTMKEFRSGERPSTVMGRIATGYSDDDIEALAAHFDRLR
ncbi:MAG: c-type cytochrome [Minwuia sp.]|uniref:c-type cytochrome n=1 Tax=Minwuia sp. TaxID=2493630 RepID=UPI003A850D06